VTTSVNIVVKADPKWILRRFAKELVKRLENVTMNETPWPPSAPSVADVTYFMPEKDIRHMPGPITGKKVGLFTHDSERMRLYHDRFDACVAMNDHVYNYLRELGARKVRRFHPGTDPPVRPIVRPIRFGVCGRVYGKGRKGAHLVEAAVREGFSFQACSEPLPRKQPPCRISHDVRSAQERTAFYDSIDYLVVTSTEEGGPMPVLEAIAHGVPIIAPDVGFCWEYRSVIRYKRGSWEDLREVLRELTEPPLWHAWAEEHGKLFAELA
jgi:glycosyltransferase involved in cell wall biosynthesis